MVSCLTFFICPFFDPISIETSHASPYGWEKIKAQLNPFFAPKNTQLHFEAENPL
jgi:hypothetical protein